jgi:Domain of unknown function (DUF4956)
MVEWLEAAFAGNGNAVALDVLALRLGAAVVLGFAVGGIYLATRRLPRAEAASFVTTLVLLAILIAMVTLIIGNNAARAFSLVGALAIIRFRTVVEDTRDTAFVIFAVVVGMAAGAGFLVVPLIGTPLVALIAWLLSLWGGAASAAPGGEEYSLAIRLGIGHDPARVFKELFAKYVLSSRLRLTATARQGAALDLIYYVRLRREDDAALFVSDLNRVDGVQSVELRPA